MLLPAIEDKVILRPTSQKHYIPNPEYNEFWSVFYDFLKKKHKIKEPIKDSESRINPYFGNFGFCFQPIMKIPKYFNLGIDISAKSKTSVYPILDGFLEYSGFGYINGKYVFLSHPEVKTEDGFVMHSLYMHLRSLPVGFTSYQKMLRKISFNKYPNIFIENDKKIGEVGSTGNIEGFPPFLHLQIEFRNDAGKIIVIDPSMILGFNKNDNMTSEIENIEDFYSFGERNKEEIKKIGFNIYWKKHD